MNPAIFIELSWIFLITVIVTGFIKILRQPAIIGYILSGIVAGPSVFNIINSRATITAFSQIGIAFLLFLVGLNLNPRVIRDVGMISLVTGIGQVLFTSIGGFFIARLLGFAIIPAIYIAIALAFSSTIIIMKLLSDKRELESLYARISTGFLIVQDFVAILILLIISTLNTGVSLASVALETILKGIGGIFILFILTIYLLPRLTKLIAKSQEFLLLFSISWCFIISALFYHLNFSIEAGALLAGMTLSVSPYHFEISSRLRSLRDFFLILFFIAIGSQMIFINFISNLPIILIFSAFVLIGNPIIVMILMGGQGYTKRNGFLAGLTVAQISEFSLIIVTMGVTLGHLSSNVLSIITAVGLITFAGSTYMIMYSNIIYPKLSKFLKIFERKGLKVDDHRHHKEASHDIILFGYNRIGLNIVESLKKIKKKFLIIDYDPEVINRLSKDGYDCRYGDANDSELLDELNFSKVKMVISTIPLVDNNLLIINKVREINKTAIISVVCHDIDDAELLYETGATYVIMPHYLGGEHFSTMLEKNKLNLDKFLEEKIAHIEHISFRKKAKHNRPIHHHS